MTQQELYNFLQLDDLEFCYKDKYYFICPFKKFYSAGEANKTEAKYKTFNELINKFTIDTKPLKDILSDIDW